MPLESASQPNQLNSAYPTDTDPAGAGAAHLRLIKENIKKLGLGKVSLTELRASNAQAGVLVTYNDSPYIIMDNFYGSSVIEDESKIIFLNNGRRAIRLFPMMWSGDFQGEAPLVPTGLTANRMPTVVFVQGASTSFNVTEIAAACPGGIPVKGDIGFYLTMSGAFRFSGAKQFNGSSWESCDFVHNGMSAAFGTFAALMLQSQRMHAIYARSHRLELVGNEKVEVRNPDGFGPDNLYYWLGTKANAIDGNGVVRYDSLTKANSIRWGGYASNGAAQEGGSTGGDTGGETTPAASAVLANLGMGTSYAVDIDSYNNTIASAVVSITLLTNGNFSVTGSQGIVGVPRSGPMVTTPGVGVGALYEFKVEQLAGGAMTGVTSGFQPLTSDYFLYVATSTGPAPSTVTVTATVRITVREKANTSNSQSRDVVLTATAQCNDGYAP